MSDRVLIERHEGIATVTLNRPEARNAFDDGLREDLTGLLETLNGDTTVSAVVVTGAGSAFSAGGDMAAMKQRLDQPPGQVAAAGWQRQQRTAALIRQLRELNAVTIAAVNGPAVGLGLDVALACDFIIASPQARFTAAFVLRGLIPDGGSMHFLPRRIGLQRAKDLLFTGRTICAPEALEIRLVDRVCDDEDVVACARTYAASMTVHSRSALALTKSILNRSLESTPEQIAALGASAQAISYTTDAHRVAVDEFLGR